MQRTSRTRMISWHAVERWQERVERGASPLDARGALRQFLTGGRVRPTPRHWTTAAPEPGLCFVYWASRPGVCALVRENTVVTILTRELCRTSRKARPEPLPLIVPTRRPRPVAPALDLLDDQAA
jgi:hypothetical protein